MQFFFFKIGEDVKKNQSGWRGLVKFVNSIGGRYNTLHNSLGGGGRLKIFSIGDGV